MRSPPPPSVVRRGLVGGGAGALDPDATRVGGGGRLRFNTEPEEMEREEARGAARRIRLEVPISTELASGEVGELPETPAVELEALPSQAGKETHHFEDVASQGRRPP